MMEYRRMPMASKFAFFLGVLSFAPVALVAESPAVNHFSMAAQPLGTALREVARITGVGILYSPDVVAGREAPALTGDWTPQQAVDMLISGTGLAVTKSGGSFVIRGRSVSPAAKATGDSREGSEIVVTGTRIRGAKTSSPTLTSSRERIEDEGFSDLGTYVRSLPQNFSGGQNPGIAGGGDQGGNQNITSSSALNLRGLGPDATLTLINGHRVAYDGANQGVDITAIPLAAIDRIEIVPDGSSALYGSDAVGGVANVILRRDFQGLETSAHFGASTDGGDAQQQYDAVTGDRWSSGGFMLAGDYNRSTEISARQRSYAQTLDDSATLLPRQRQYSFVVAGHEALSDQLVFNLDGQYSDRRSFIGLPFTSDASYLISGSTADLSVRSYSITPSLQLTLANNWTVTLSGTHGDSRAQPYGCVYAGGVAITCSQTRYDDSLDSVEAGAEGALFSLPGGDVRLALGGGYRSVGLSTQVTTTTGGRTEIPTAYAHSRHVAFAYGEVSLPLVGTANALPLVHELSFSGAARYEHYSGIGGVATPKFGLIYAPVPGLSLKASWGRSFKAPTLDQQYQIRQAVLYPSDSLGANQPADQTTIILAGGNSNLKPEKASTWTIGATLEPPAVPGLTVEASYFHIHYRDRVVEPLLSWSGLLDNPVYRDLIIFDPSLAQVGDAIAGLPEGLRNFTGAAFDPALVGAIANDSLQNTASQTIHGIDMRVDYQFVLAGGDRFDLNGSASYLVSSEKLSADQPSIPLAGTIFNPPHWRARGGGQWERDGFSLSAFVNYVGGTLDNRLQPFAHVGSMTTVDLSAHLAPAQRRGPLSGVEIILSCLNLSNVKPPAIRNTNVYDPPYDSTNASAVGRIVSLTLSRKW